MVTGSNPVKNNKVYRSAILFTAIFLPATAGLIGWLMETLSKKKGLTYALSSRALWASAALFLYLQFAVSGLQANAFCNVATSAGSCDILICIMYSLKLEDVELVAPFVVFWAYAFGVHKHTIVLSKKRAVGLMLLVTLILFLIFVSAVRVSVLC